MDELALFCVNDNSIILVFVLKTLVVFDVKDLVVDDVGQKFKFSFFTVLFEVELGGN